VYNIKMDLGDRGWGGVDWIGLALMSERVPQNAGFLSSDYNTGGHPIVLSFVELVSYLV
jgi:hypothetical protein